MLMIFCCGVWAVFWLLWVLIHGRQSRSRIYQKMGVPLIVSVLLAQSFTAFSLDLNCFLAFTQCKIKQSQIVRNINKPLISLAKYSSTNLVTFFSKKLRLFLFFLEDTSYSSLYKEVIVRDDFSPATFNINCNIFQIECLLLSNFFLCWRIFA